MADLNSWEDDQDAQDQNLANQTQQNLNLGGQHQQQQQRGGFQPGAASFQPGAQSFTPGQTYQYGAGGGYPQYGQQAYGQYQQYGYPQYGQQQQPQQQQQQGYGQYNQGYGQYGQQGYQQYGQGQGYAGGYQQQQPQGQNYNQQGQKGQQNQQRQVPVIAKRPQAGEASSEPAAAKAPAAPAAEAAKSAAAPAAAAAPKAKVLSIGGDGAPKVAKTLSIGGDGQTKLETGGKTKVLSIGSTGPASSAKDNVNKASPAAGAKVTAAKAIEKTGETGAAAATGKTSPTPSTGRNSPTRAGERPTKDADAVLKEQEAELDEETLAEMYGKEHVNVIFLGHVDAGKSTLGGSILYATGMVDERTLDKYKREAKEAGRETWYLSWALDLTKEERAKGKTVEVGRGFFETEKRRYTILDAPGHKTFVPNMIGGASQADVGVLVISARKGEYETGFEKGGQTREHAVLAKTQGVNKLIVVVNKMDDPTVNWSQERYKECTTKLTLFLRGINYNPKTGRT